MKQTSIKIIESKVICPTCNGSGEFTVLVEIPQYKTSQVDLINNIKRLRKRGLSLRQIGQRVGIKNAGTVRYYLEKGDGITKKV